MQFGRQKAKAVEFLLLLRLSLRKSQITGDSVSYPSSSLHQHRAVAVNNQASAYSLKSTCLLTGPFAVRKVCLPQNNYRVPYYQDFVTHSYYYLGPPSPHYRRAKDPRTLVSICFVPHPADWIKCGLIKLRCHIQDCCLLCSQIDSSHILCRPATASPVCIAIKTKHLHNAPRRC